MKVQRLLPPTTRVKRVDGIGATIIPPNNTDLGYKWQLVVDTALGVDPDTAIVNCQDVWSPEILQYGGVGGIADNERTGLRAHILRYELRFRVVLRSAMWTGVFSQPGPK